MLILDTTSLRTLLAGREASQLPWMVRLYRTLVWAFCCLRVLEKGPLWKLAAQCFRRYSSQPQYCYFGCPTNFWGKITAYILKHCPWSFVFWGFAKFPVTKTNLWFNLKTLLSFRPSWNQSLFSSDNPHCGRGNRSFWEHLTPITTMVPKHFTGR